MLGRPNCALAAGSEWVAECGRVSFHRYAIWVRATYQALTGPLAGQFLGYVHGEAPGSPGVRLADKPLASGRRAHADAAGRDLVKQQAAAWGKVFKTAVPESHWAKGIACLSVDSPALAHLFYERGAATVGYEVDATMPHVPLRIAFHRGAARQYGGTWINYASGNFGDACCHFGQEPVVPRGAKGWFHSKYAVTDRVTAGWYRKLYYLNYLGGASAVFWEQSLNNQWILPGPGQHVIELSPFGRATEEFHAFVDRLPDRGEPITPGPADCPPPMPRCGICSRVCWPRTTSSPLSTWRPAWNT